MADYAPRLVYDANDPSWTLAGSRSRIAASQIPRALNAEAELAAANAALLRPWSFA
jgi:hypothetical protein